MLNTLAVRELLNDQTELASSEHEINLELHYMGAWTNTR